MYKVMTLGTLLVGLALTPFISGADREARSEVPVVNSHTEELNVVSEVAAQPEGPRSCEWSCELCEEGESCTQTCTEVGSCGSTCGFVMECADGLRWDETECGCH